MSQAPVPHTVITSRQTENTPLTVSMEDHYPQSYETVTDRPPAALIRDEEEEDACSRTGSTASTQSRAFRRGSNSSAMPWGGHSQPSVHFEGGPRSGAMPAAQGSVEKQANSTIPLNRKRLLHNAVHMSTCFAANEGCLTAVLAVSSAIINPHLFATSAGTLYLSFAFGTIVAPALVNLTGLRLSLVLGLASYTLYIGCFIFPSWYSLIPSSAIAGLLGSLLWTSQGVYFTTNAVLYSEASLGDIPLRSAISYISAIFATIFPFFLAVLKVTSSLILHAGFGYLEMYCVYAALALVATIVMTQVLPLQTPPDVENENENEKGVSAPASAQEKPTAQSQRDSMLSPGEVDGGSTSPTATSTTLLPSGDAYSERNSEPCLSMQGFVDDQMSEDTDLRRVFSNSMDSASEMLRQRQDMRQDMEQRSPRWKLMRITSQDDLVEPVKVQLGNPANSMTSMRRLAVTLKANIDDVKMPLLMFTNFAYGVMSAYFPLIVTQTVADTLGSSNVGILYAISGMASCILAMGFGGVAEWCGQHGRAIIMVVGAASFGIVCFVFTVCAASFYSQWKVLIPLFILYGSGQAVWQGTCMAIFADYWQATPAAYANLKLHSGLASAVAFFAFPLMGDRHIGMVCGGVVAIGIVTYLMAHAIHCRETDSRAHMSGGMYVILEAPPGPANSWGDAMQAPGSPRTSSGSVNDPSAGSINYPDEEALLAEPEEEPGSPRVGSPCPRHSSTVGPGAGSGVSVSIVDRIIILNRPQTETPRRKAEAPAGAFGGVMPL